MAACVLLNLLCDTLNNGFFEIVEHLRKHQMSLKFFREICGICRENHFSGEFRFFRVICQQRLILPCEVSRNQKLSQVSVCEQGFTLRIYYI
jgi:hypothetical protein